MLLLLDQERGLFFVDVTQFVAVIVVGSGCSIQIDFLIL